MVNVYSEKMVGYILHFHMNILYSGQVIQTTVLGNTHTTYRKYWNSTRVAENKI
jgi:hypothetical protein